MAPKHHFRSYEKASNTRPRIGTKRARTPSERRLQGDAPRRIAGPLCEGRRFVALRTAPLMAAAAGTAPSAGGDGPQSDASLLGPFSPGTPLFFARLYLAARDGDVAAVNALLADNKPTGDAKHWDECTDINNVGVLCIAVQYGRLEVVKALLAAGADPNDNDRYGMSPLLAAVRGHRTPMIKALIAAGADVNAIYHNDDDGLSAMSAAVGTRNADVVKALLAAKADPDAGLCTDTIFSHIDESCYKCCDNMRRQPSPLVKAVKQGNLPIIRALLRAKADPNLHGTDCSRPLFEAVRNSDCSIAIIKTLLAAGADPNLRGDTCGTWPLFEALGDSDLSVAVTEVLLAAGADVNAVTHGGKTALTMAARHGYVDVIKALIAAGADMNARDVEGKTPAQVAADKKQPAAVAALAAASASAGTSSSKPRTSKNAASRPRRKKTSRK